MNPNQLQNENLLQSIMLSWSISNILCIQIHYLKLKLLATDNHQGEQDFTFFQNEKNIWELTSPCGFALNNWESFSCGVKNSCHSMTSISLEMENTKLLRITSIIHCSKNKVKIMVSEYSCCLVSHLTLLFLLILGSTLERRQAEEY